MATKSDTTSKGAANGTKTPWNGAFSFDSMADEGRASLDSMVKASAIAAKGYGEIGNAFIDVFEEEPLAAGNVFEGVPNAALTPHCAGLTQEALLRSSLMIAESVRDALGPGG